MGRLHKIPRNHDYIIIGTYDRRRKRDASFFRCVNSIVNHSHRASDLMKLYVMESTLYYHMHLNVLIFQMAMYVR